MFAYLIKPMESATEIDGKGYVHHKSWQETYKGLVDESYLRGMSLEKSIAIAHKFPDNIAVAKDDDNVIGFVGYGFDDATNIGEIFALYVLAEYQGKKVGYNLMNYAFFKLKGCKKIALWVLKGNSKAISFYKKYGFRLNGEEKQIMLGTPNTEFRMVYDNTKLN